MPERDDVDQDTVDRWLRQAMAEPQPRLSSRFDRVLSRKLRGHHLTPAGRWALTLYALVALALSVWLMRRASIDWIYVAAALFVPIASVGVVLLRTSRRFAARLSSL